MIKVNQGRHRAHQPSCRKRILRSSRELQGVKEDHLSRIPAHKIEVTVAPFRAWRSLPLFIARGPRWPHQYTGFHCLEHLNLGTTLMRFQILLPGLRTKAARVTVKGHCFANSHRMPMACVLARRYGQCASKSTGLDCDGVLSRPSTCPRYKNPVICS